MAQVERSLATMAWQAVDRHAATRVVDGKQVPDHLTSVANNVGMVGVSAMMLVVGVGFASPKDPLPPGYRPETLGDKALRMSNGAFLAMLSAGLIVKDSADAVAHLPGAALQAAKLGLAKLTG